MLMRRIHCTKACCAVRAQSRNDALVITLAPLSRMTKQNITLRTKSEASRCTVQKGKAVSGERIIFEKTIDEAMYRPDEGCVNTCTKPNLRPCSALILFLLWVWLTFLRKAQTENHFELYTPERKVSASLPFPF